MQSQTMNKGLQQNSLKKVPKTPEFVDTDSDRTDDEQEPTAKQPQKASKTPELVDTDKDDEQE